MDRAMPRCVQPVYAGRPQSPDLLRKRAEQRGRGVTNADVCRRLRELANELDQEAAALKPEEEVAQPPRRR